LREIKQEKIYAFMTIVTRSNLDLPLKHVLTTWWPLAASWLLMGVELPILSAIVARLPNPEINLAAYGGVVFPLSLIIEAPIIMLLAASTALSKDWHSYRLIYRFMIITASVLTGVHLLVAFTPLYFFVVDKIIGVPQEIINPSRIGLMIMLPWTFSIAYRRFHQGILIRFGYSRAVGVGTVIRLSANVIVLLIGYFYGKFPGIVVASSAVATGVVAEAIFIGIVVRPVIKNNLLPAPPVEPALSLRSFLDFYIPLAMTSLLTLLANPIGSAALSRMPLALSSLAVWPVITGLIFMLRSLGIALNEVVVALLDIPRSSKNLFRFALFLSAGTTAALLLITATPLSGIWFRYVSALDLPLAQLAQKGIWIALPLPALSVMQSWYQGAILYGRKTQGITESVVIYLLTSAITLGIGVWLASIAGLYVGLFSLTLSVAMQTIWLWIRSRPVLAQLKERDFLTVE
jgi:hypothetical protein